jgi:predicted permease
MSFSKPMAALVLAATIAPLAYVLYFLGCVVITIATQSPDAAPWVPEEWLIVLHLGCIFWTWGLIAFYVFFLFKTDAVPKDQKALWAVVLFFANVVVMPIFWWLYVWPAKKSGPDARL